MPLYEYLCRSCHRKTTVLVRSASQEVALVCSTCGSRDLERTLSSFAYHKASSSAERGDYYRDPRNIGRWAEKRFQEMGQELTPELREMVGKAREGEVEDILESRGLRKIEEV